MARSAVSPPPPQTCCNVLTANRLRLKYQPSKHPPTRRRLLAPLPRQHEDPLRRISTHQHLQEEEPRFNVHLRLASPNRQTLPHRLHLHGLPRRHAQPAAPQRKHDLLPRQHLVLLRRLLQRLPLLRRRVRLRMLLRVGPPHRLRDPAPRRVQDALRRHGHPDLWRCKPHRRVQE